MAVANRARVLTLLGGLVAAAAARPGPTRRAASQALIRGERHRALLRAAGDSLRDARPPRPARGDKQNSFRGHARLRPRRARRPAHGLWVADLARRMRASSEVGALVRASGAGHRRKDARACSTSGGLPGRAHRGEELLFLLSRGVEQRAQARGWNATATTSADAGGRAHRTVRAPRRCASALAEQSLVGDVRCSSTTSTAFVSRALRPSSATPCRDMLDGRVRADRAGGSRASTRSRAW